MLSSSDGRIDGASLEAVTGQGEYEATGALLQGDAWLCGRITMERHFADGKPKQLSGALHEGGQTVHVAKRAESYAVVVDTKGRLSWQSGELHGDHLICIVCENIPSDYLELLRSKGISYIVTGKDRVDLSSATELLHREFGIATLLLEGGGHINGGFLQAELIDEISLLLVPGIDGRTGIPSVFEGLPVNKEKAVALTLKSVDRRDHDALWLRYEVVRHEA